MSSLLSVVRRHPIVTFFVLSLQAQGWIYMGVWLAAAIGLVVFDGNARSSAAPAKATTPPQATPPKGATSAAPA